MMTRLVREIKVREKKRETVSHADASHTQSLRPRREKTRTGRNETRITRRSSRNCPLPPTTELTELYHSASPPPSSHYHPLTTTSPLTSPCVAPRRVCACACAIILPPFLLPRCVASRITATRGSNSPCLLS